MNEVERARGRRRLFMIGVAGLVVLAGAGWWWRTQQAKKPVLRTQAVERGRIVAAVSATGSLNPVNQVEVGSQVSGTISSLRADYNDQVRAGQVLATLEPSLFRAAVVRAEADLARAEAARTESELALRRARGLKERNVISEVELEAAESAYKQRAAEVRQASASLQTARVNMGHTVIKAPISGVVVARAVDVGQTVAASLSAPTLYTLAQDLTRMRVETKIDEADVGRIRPGLAARFTVDAFPDDEFEGTVSQVRLEPVVEDNVVTYTTVIDVPNPDLKLRPGMTANVTIVIDTRNNVLRVPNAALRFRPPGEQRGGGAVAGAGGAGGAGAGEARAATQGGGRRFRQGGVGGDTARWAGRRGGGDSTRAGRSGGGAARMQRVYVLDAGDKFHPVQVRTGITDGAFTEVIGGELQEGQQVVLSLDSPVANANLPAPPGFGGGPGGGGGRGGGGGGRR